MIDLITKTMKQHNKTVISNGRIMSDVEISDEPVTVEMIEKLYAKYKYSIPHENRKSDSKYFKALSQDELTDEQLITGKPRKEAAEALERTILTGIINKSLTWESFKPKNEKQWFWKSKKDPDLVILKEWITLGGK